MKVADSVIRFVNIEGVGGFPVSNLAYWHNTTRRDANGEDERILHIQFLSGGFLELPDTTEEEFSAQVYGQNPAF